MVSYGLHHLKRSINHGLSTASGGHRSARNPIVLKLLVNSLMGLISSHPPQSCGPLAIALSGEARSGGGDEVQYEPAAATDACPDQSMGGLSAKEAAMAFPAASADEPAECSAHSRDSTGLGLRPSPPPWRWRGIQLPPGRACMTRTKTTDDRVNDRSGPHETDPTADGYQGWTPRTVFRAPSSPGRRGDAALARRRAAARPGFVRLPLREHPEVVLGAVRLSDATSS